MIRRALSVMLVLVFANNCAQHRQDKPFTPGVEVPAPAGCQVLRERAGAEC